MMRIVFTSVLAASLLIHAVIGCCRCCVQAARDCDHLPVASAPQTACCHHHHASTDKQEREPPTPCKGHSNCHGMCNYLPAQKSQTGNVLSLVPIDFIVEIVAVDRLRFACHNYAELAGRPLQPPLRLHLLNQIILV